MYNSRLVKAEIDLEALAFNVTQIKSLLNPQTKFMAVVKANAYGHGAVPIARELEKIGVDMLGVSCLYEVRELRNANIKLPILNFGALLNDDVEAVFEYDFIPTIFTIEIAKLISNLAVKKNKIVKIHVKVDTGLNRIGVSFKDAVKLVKQIHELPNIEIEGLYTHLAAAEDVKHIATKIQLFNFDNVTKNLQNENIVIPIIHAANSAGALLWKESHYNMVRIGISLYGCKPSAKINLPIELKPVLTLKTFITYLKTLPKDMPISYGWKFYTKKQSTIATLGVGYGDGFRRTPKNWGHVLINGKKARILGIVCMDQTMVDVSRIKKSKIGDEVVLIGKQGEEEINFWDLAKQLKTSAYEILCAISARVNRVYINGK